jgi:hypothetical protein
LPKAGYISTSCMPTKHSTSAIAALTASTAAPMQRMTPIFCICFSSAARRRQMAEGKSSAAGAGAASAGAASAGAASASADTAV